MEEREMALKKVCLGVDVSGELVGSGNGSSQCLNSIRYYGGKTGEAHRTEWEGRVTVVPSELSW